MLEKVKLEEIMKLHGFNDFKWINPQRDIVVAHWVRFRCLYGCSSYGKCGTCPPYVPPVDECQKMIGEYSIGILFHLQKTVEKPNDRKAWSRNMILELLKLEKEVFLSGYHKTLLIPFDNCGLCEVCSGNRINCKNPQMVRAGADALGIDVFTTVKRLGFPLQVLKDYSETMNRYGFLLIE